jgi:hypothetical protein
VKLLFLVLLLANLAVLAWQQGVFGRMPESGREPERVNRQIEPERIRALAPDDVAAIRSKAREVPNPQSPLAGIDLSSGQACVEFGDFSNEALARVQPRMDAMALGERLSARVVEVPGWYMVYLPPLKTRAEANRAADEMRKRGVKELLVIADNSPLRFGIALGSFRDPELARQHQAALDKRGVKGVRVAETPSTLPGTRFQIKGVDAPLAQSLTAIHKDFPQSRLAACAAN